MSQPKIAAAIDIGSNAIKMLIAEIEGPGQLRVLEDVRLDSPIGDDTFTNGRIRPEAMFSVCRSLKHMSQLMKDYGVRHYRAYATSGVREASNSLYFLEHVRQATQMDVELIDRSVERFLTYQSLNYGLTAMPTLRAEGLLMVEIGSAGVQMSVFADGKLRFSDHVRIGTLKLKEILDSLRGESLQYTEVLQQYIESQLGMLHERIQAYNLPHYLVLGGETASLVQRTHELVLDVRGMSTDVFNRYHRDIIQSGTFKLAHKFQLDEERADQMIPTSIIMSELWKATAAEHVLIPDLSLRHGVLHQLAAEWSDGTLSDTYVADMIATALHTAERYQLDIAHSLKVKELATKLLHKCNASFHLDASYELCLQLAAILHDIGKHISQEGHAANSYHMLKSMDMLGITDKQKEIIASIALYHPRGTMVPIRPELSTEENIALARLTSLLKLADALDCSHRQKVQDIKITWQHGEYLQVKPLYEGSLELETWAFMQESPSFEQISGYPIRLKP
ncbi:HD domain-containing protein [Paenibacillus sp. ACRRX]|uniref:Ppx/GppA phosphatase family protein n=1 Tax=unclassified Paenibacillus TaxID=185978 RepID=UPI001EF542F5|nr:MULTISPECIES: HD domain-containing protein [unclassified Paenibacillus]MCG7410031.1 HD domain-containing protein [Paenibacillus sp. ACRRX]MDK8183980.1 HD domain-containing protein [Paenibacillus sp. UMB4589-SE434]